MIPPGVAADPRVERPAVFRWPDTIAAQHGRQRGSAEQVGNDHGEVSACRGDDRLRIGAASPAPTLSGITVSTGAPAAPASAERNPARRAISLMLLVKTRSE
jgi:hypothetical protein